MGANPITPLRAAAVLEGPTPQYGDPLVGEWWCVNCHMRLFPRQAREMFEMHDIAWDEEAKAFVCPICPQFTMQYGEAA